MQNYKFSRMLHGLILILILGYVHLGGGVKNLPTER